MQASSINANGHCLCKAPGHWDELSLLRLSREAPQDKRREKKTAPKKKKKGCLTRKVWHGDKMTCKMTTKTLLNAASFALTDKGTRWGGDLFGILKKLEFTLLLHIVGKWIRVLLKNNLNVCVT